MLKVEHLARQKHLSRRQPVGHGSACRREQQSADAPGGQSSHRQLHFAQVEAFVLMRPALEQRHAAALMRRHRQHVADVRAPSRSTQCGMSR